MIQDILTFWLLRSPLTPTLRIDLAGQPVRPDSPRQLDQSPSIWLPLPVSLDNMMMDTKRNVDNYRSNSTNNLSASLSFSISVISGPVSTGSMSVLCPVMGLISCPSTRVSVSPTSPPLASRGSL